MAELLLEHGEVDDAAYHFGICGENAVKQMLRLAGVEAAWITAGAANGKTPRQALANTPMRGHFPSLVNLVQAAQQDIALYATGRYSAHISSLVLSSSFKFRFAGWEINIRYADSVCTPVTQQDCSAWNADADDLVLALV